MIAERERACTSWCLPSTYNHSCRKIECQFGRHFMMQPLRGRHTPSRHHAVCAVSTTLRAYTTGDGLTALSYAPRHTPPPGTARRKDRKRTPLHSVRLILSRHVHNPTLRKRSVNTLSNSPPQAPRRKDGGKLEATDGKARCLQSDGLPQLLERECAYAL